MIKIEKGIPIPPVQRYGNGLTKEHELTEALRKMSVGDSFRLDKYHRGTCHAIASYYNLHLTTRTISPTEIRVWRTK
jgi:hypothetical protein